MSSSSPVIENVVARIGIDWADQHHDVALRAVGSNRTERARIRSTPEALQEWIAEIRRRFPEGQVAIGLEQSKGALMHALLEHEFLLLYPINPASVHSFRKAFASSGAKSDPGDAELVMELLEKHGRRFHPWKPDDEKTRALGRLAESRRKAVDLQTQLTQRLTTELKGYFPQALDWAGKLTSPMAHDFLRRWPTLHKVQRAQASTLRRFYSTHHCRSAKAIDKRLKQIRTAVPLVRDPAIVDTSVLNVQMLVEQLAALARSIDRYDNEIASLFGDHPDAHLFESLPGSGPVLAPRLLAAFGTDRDRFSTAVELQQYSGTAPVTRASGKKRSVHRRWAAPRFLRQTFHEFAGHSIRYSGWARAYYEQMRERGLAHHAAVRTLAFKWIRILFRCWKSRTPYDEHRYVEALRHRGSPLAQRITATTA